LLSGFLGTSQYINIAVQNAEFVVHISDVVNVFPKLFYLKNLSHKHQRSVDRMITAFLPLSMYFKFAVSYLRKFWAVEMGMCVSVLISVENPSLINS